MPLEGLQARPDTAAAAANSALLLQGPAAQGSCALATTPATQQMTKAHVHHDRCGLARGHGAWARHAGGREHQERPPGLFDWAAAMDDSDRLAAHGLEGLELHHHKERRPQIHSHWWPWVAMGGPRVSSGRGLCHSVAWRAAGTRLQVAGRVNNVQMRLA